LETLVAAKEIVIVCGAGGVGKTTSAAALAAMAAARQGGKVLVVTVDPARRLAAALGIEHLGNNEIRVPVDSLTGRSGPARGQLWAAMLDMKQSWDALVRLYAPDAATAARIMQNPLYQNISGRFVQSHDYIAMERLYQLHSGGDYDLIVVDTPPSRHAVDFIEAPERMADFFSSRLLRLLTVPYRSRMVNLASRPFYQLADRVLGSQFLEDIAEFFILFQTMNAGFVQRARAVERLLADQRTTFVVVSTAESAALAESAYLMSVLSEKRLHLGALVFNKVLPEWLLDEGAEERALRLVGLAPELARHPGLRPAAPGDAVNLERVLREIGDNFGNFSVVARRESLQRGELSALPDVVAVAPELDADIFDLEGLARLGRAIWA
jgi:anion-transporting  ArsA/GET3 family ATPase